MKNNDEQNGCFEVFWNRTQELAVLDDWYRQKPRFGVIHGRRRLGKTALLRHWLRRTSGAYVQATEGTSTTQRAALAADLQAVMPGFDDVTYPTWLALFEALARQWPRSAPASGAAAGSGLPPVLVLDEFPYLAQAAPELPSLLQAFLDKPDAAHVPILICGSSQRMMQGLVLDAGAPLYGRAQLLLRLHPLPPREIRAALGLPTAVTAVEAYAAWGGVARYWGLVRDGAYAGTDAALDSLVLSPRGVLHEEADRVLRDEEAALLERATCELVGRGACRPSELAARLGVKETTLAKPLRHLVELGLIERQTPYDFTQGAPVAGGRRAFYRLADSFLSMWYACVRPYLSGLNLEAETARQHAREAWGHHVAATWETLCRQQWHRLRFLDMDWEPAGRYWVSRETSGAEWDVASVSADRRHIFLGECKWMRSPTRAKVDAVVRLIQQRPLPLLNTDAPDAPVSHVTVHLGLFIPELRQLPVEIDGVTLFDAAHVLPSLAGC